MALLGWLFGKKGGAAGGVTESRELFSLTRTVDVPAAKAFEVFVDQFQSWWPKSETWANERLKTTVIEAKYGGRCFETDTSGGTQMWGKVLTLSRPDHIVIAWQIKPDRSPEPEEALASRLDIRFLPVEGKTELMLVHRDFPRHGDGWEKYKSEMAKRWPGLLDAYVRAVGGMAK